MKKHAFRLWAVMGVMTFSAVAVAAGFAVFQSWHDSRAYAAPGDLIVTESPNWQSMEPQDKWRSATDHSLIPVPVSDYTSSQQSTYNVLKKEDSSSSARLEMAAYFDSATKDSNYSRYVYIADPVFMRYNSGPRLGQYRLDAVTGQRMPGRNCQTYDPLNTYGPSDTFISVTLSYELTTGGTRTATYNIPENNVCPPNATTASRPTNDNSETDTANNDFFARYPIPGFAFNPGAKMDPDTKLYKVNVTIAYDTNVQFGFTNLGINSRQQLVFRVKIPNGGTCLPGVCRRFIGMLAAKDNPATEGFEPNFSTLSRLLDDVSNISSIPDRFYGAQKFEFGLTCGEGPSEKKVTVYDLDNNNMGGKFAGYFVESFDTTTGSWKKLPVSDYTKVINGTILSVDTVYDYNYETDGDLLTPMIVKQGMMPAQTIMPTTGSGVVSTVTIKMNPDVRYRLVVDPLWSNNLLTVGLPTDSIYGLTTCPSPVPDPPECLDGLMVSYMGLNETVQLQPGVRLPNVVLGGPSPDWTLNLTVTSPTGVTTPYNNIPYTTSNSGLITELMATGVPLTATQSGTYQFAWTLGGASGSLITGFSCSAEASSGDQPYFKVYGGDILAGIALKNPTTDPDSIIGWNQNSGSYAGAGSQLAAIASGNISHFISNSDVIIGTGVGTTLAFGNTLAAVGNKYGGDFEHMPAVPPYIDAALARTPGGVASPIASNNLDVNTLASGIYEYSGGGDLTISGTLDASKNVTIIVRSGNVYIDNPITYASYDLTSVPQLNVYTTGNIVVDSTVNEIHGIFVAEEATSRFYTCGTSASNPIGYAEMDANQTLVDQCNDTALTVYGSVVAHEVILSRTSGSWVNGGLPSEVFRHGPEAWLPRPFGTSGMGDTYDNYISLPPVL